MTNARFRPGRSTLHNEADERTRAQGIDSPVLHIIFALAVSLLSASLPLAIANNSATLPLSWASCIIAGIAIFVTSRRFLSIMLTVLAMSFILSYTGSPTSIAAILGTVMACGIYCSAAASAKKTNILFLFAAPLLSLSLTYALTLSLPLSLLSVAYLPASLAMGITARKGRDCKSAVTVFAFVAITEIILYVGGHIFLQNGTISLDIIEHAVRYLENSIDWAFRTAILNMGNAEMTEALSIEIRNMAADAVNIIPGATVLLAVVIGYIAHTFTCSVFERFDEERLLNSSRTEITASCTAATLFLIAHIFSYTSGASSAPSFIGVAAQNLSLALLPVILCVGFNKLLALPRKMGFLALVIWLGLFLASNAMGISVLTAIALIGAFYIIIARIDVWAKGHYSKGDNT